jgi:hypothetical protein
MSAQIFYIDFKFTGNTGNSGNKAIESAVYGVPSIERRVGTLGTIGLRRRIETVEVGNISANGAKVEQLGVDGQIIVLEGFSIVADRALR